jgi:hypothetical protein
LAHAILHSAKATSLLPHSGHHHHLLDRRSQVDQLIALQGAVAITIEALEQHLHALISLRTVSGTVLRLHAVLRLNLLTLGHLSSALLPAGSLSPDAPSPQSNNGCNSHTTE